MKILILIRSILATFLFPLTVLLLGPLSIVFHFLFRSRHVDDIVIQCWGRLCCLMSGVWVEVEGLENIPDRGCLFLFNHSSFFDVFAIAGYIPGLRFGAKAELFKIPVFGHAMQALGTLPIHRQRREEVFKIYEEAKVRFHNKEKFALAPEGGRFYGPQLSPFKAGPFLFAMSAQAPLVPVIILGAHECLPKGHILFNPRRWMQRVQIKILKPIETVGYEVANRHELQKVVYDVMNPHWVRYFGQTLIQGATNSKSSSAPSNVSSH